MQRAFSARRGTTRAFPAQRCTVREQRSARGAWPLSKLVPCAALCCPALRGNAQRGERAGPHRGTRTRGAARSCTLLPQPAPGAGSLTDDMHSAGTPRGAPPALLPSMPAECPPLSPRRPELPSYAQPTHSRQPALLASPRPRLMLAGLSRPPAHRCDDRATSAARQRLAPSLV